MLCRRAIDGAEIRVEKPLGTAGTERWNDVRDAQRSVHSFSVHAANQFLIGGIRERGSGGAVQSTPKWGRQPTQEEAAKHAWRKNRLRLDLDGASEILAGRP